MPLLLNDMPLERANQIFRHPIHQDSVGTLVQLITALRQCRRAEDYYHFQQDLLARVLDVQEHRAGCRRVAKLLRQGKAVPANAPELRSTDPVTTPETWELEADACERVDRQLRSVADALAWRAFSYDRRVIIALSRNQHPGPMAGKKGLAAERAFVIDWWRDERRFVLLHDLTSCLSIGDATRRSETNTRHTCTRSSLTPTAPCLGRLGVSGWRNRRSAPAAPCRAIFPAVWCRSTSRTRPTSSCWARPSTSRTSAGFRA
jgi:hypothetical protein